MAKAFIGSEAFAAGTVTKYDLRARYQRILPDIYLTQDAPPSLQDRTIATWLWSQRQGVISGVAASALHGAKWVDQDAVIESTGPAANRRQGSRFAKILSLARRLFRAMELASPALREPRSTWRGRDQSAGPSNALTR